MRIFHLYNIQTIDLSGYQLDDLTLFPQGVLLQDMSTLPSGTTGWPSGVRRATMVTNTPISESDLTDWNGLEWHLPGSLESTFNLDNVFTREQNYILN